MSPIQGRDRLGPTVFVVAPVLVLSAISGLVLALVCATAGLDVPGIPAILIGGALAYCAAVFVLIRSGLANFRQLESLGQTDSLAGVPNRRALHRDFGRIDSREDRALALLDLDGFKSINDQYGHFVGDKLIKECARLLRGLCAGSDAACYRLGGDEFAILAVGPHSQETVEDICARLLRRLAASIIIGERKLIVGASIGISHCSGAQLSSAEMLRRSDVAMYVSKSGGKNRYTWFAREFDRDREQALRTEADLRDAMRLGEFAIVYQPVVDTRSEAIVGAEALLRWERTDGSSVEADEFIPIAERSGLIYPIGLWVLRKACSEALGWGGITLAVNISPAQLRNPDFPEDLCAILEETGLPPRRLELEITEQYLVNDAALANRNLEAVRRLGVAVALDDFGSGYASIGYLRRFRFDKLKIDRSLIADGGSDRSSFAMIASSIAVARALKMAVTAEGVETREQADLVRSAGFDQSQGWFFAGAVSAREIEAQIAWRRRRARAEAETLQFAR